MKRKTTYRKMQSRDLFFEEDKTRDAMHCMGNPLDRVREMIDFEMFRHTLEDALENKNRKNNAGRKPFDPVLMFKILFLQRYYGLGDHNTQYQILDRLEKTRACDPRAHRVMTPLPDNRLTPKA